MILKDGQGLKAQWTQDKKVCVCALLVKTLRLYVMVECSKVIIGSDMP
jgi:hypothetical protein